MTCWVFWSFAGEGDTEHHWGSSSDGSSQPSRETAEPDQFGSHVNLSLATCPNLSESWWGKAAEEV